ncbi:MAG: carboxymuconolactone decarboxylase family protein [Phycisphaeraceae bacterium]|nr:carboxymuconolactone decarboxylase family protein [Phycisphaeraceae bacterium]
MSRLPAVSPESATGKAKELLDAVKHKLGLVPNMTKVMANSPAVLDGYLAFSGALNASSLPVKLREQIAIVTAQTNACNYCLSAHTAIGKMVGLTADELGASRNAGSPEAKTAAALAFARRLAQTGGSVTNADFENVRQAGWNDGAIAEIIASVALNLFTNIFNKSAETEIDFPVVKA